MRRLKNRVTLEDLERLRRIHRDLRELTVGFNPSAPECQALMATLWVLRQCIVEWSGDPGEFFRGQNG